MKIQFRSNQLRNAYYDRNVRERLWGRIVANKYVQRVGFVADASGIDELRANRSLRFHAFTGDRAGQFGIDLTGNMRLVVSFTDKNEVTIILEVTDYH
ncbi:MAG: type II toxin-antitoxin system RelE/ParE family toxin [Chloroflexi bacterium]|nr:type II toxin-antitoxin system RelE/ParE family toxin [Chloroflexota bacterium]